MKCLHVCMNERLFHLALSTRVIRAQALMVCLKWMEMEKLEDGQNPHKTNTYKLMDA